MVVKRFCEPKCDTELKCGYGNENSDDNDPDDGGAYACHQVKKCKPVCHVKKFKYGNCFFKKLCGLKLKCGYKGCCKFVDGKRVCKVKYCKHYSGY